MSENYRLGTGSLRAAYFYSSFACVARTLFHTFAHHPISTARNLPTNSLPALYLFRRPSTFSTASNSAAGASLSLFDACLFSTAPYLAVGSLLAHYIVLIRISYFNRPQCGYRCVTRYRPRSDARLPFQPLAIRLKVCCPLSTWFRCVSPFSTATYLPTCSPLVSICPIENT